MNLQALPEEALKEILALTEAKKRLDLREQAQNHFMPLLTTSTRILSRAGTTGSSRKSSSELQGASSNVSSSIFRLAIRSPSSPAF